MHALIRSGSRIAVAALAALTLPLLSPLAVLAADETPAGASVARLSVVSGNVAIQRGDSTSSPVVASVNAPVLGSDYVTTGPGSRAEVQFTGTSMVRLGSNVQMRFTRLDATTQELQLAQGTLVARVLPGTDGAPTIDTPSISVRPDEPGSYRVSVTDDGQTFVTVRAGRADIVTPQGTQPLGPGTTLLASGEASNPSITSRDAIAFDDIDRFNTERDAYYTHAQSLRSYASPAIDGVDDLSQNGRWVNDTSYGNVWVPSNVGADWAPYRDGRWVWEGPYGWTWVADEPWGWAPYHYGNWYHSPRYGWAWCPPHDRYAPVWRPALVAFFSFGGGGISFGIGQDIGWVPLAPYEAYHPWYGDRDGNTIVNNYYVNNYYVNNVSNTNISHTYRNVQFGGGTSVSHQRFTEGRFDHPVAVRATQLRNVQIARGAVPIVPTANNLRFNDRPVNAAVAVRPAIMNRSFAGTPTAVRRVSFDQQRAALATAAHLPAPPPLARNERFAAPAANTAPQRAPSAWDRFGTRVPSANARYQPVAPGTQQRPQTDSWSRFNANRNGTAIERAPQNAQRSPYTQPVQQQEQRPQDARPVQPQQQQRPQYTRPVQPPQQQRPQYTRPAQQPPRPAASESRREESRPTSQPH